MVTKRPKGLGRGLEALLGPTFDENAATNAANLAAAKAAEQANPGTPSTLMLTDMVAGQYQPRTRMDEGALYELAESIKAQGIMQPILVRRLTSGANEGKYEIIAGERRFRASKLAGLDSVPVLVREVPDEAAAAMALIENIQREDLNPLEEAQGLQRLVKEFSLTHEQAAQAVGRSRAAASNLMRLLNLADPVQTMLMAGDFGHGSRPRLAGFGPRYPNHVLLIKSVPRKCRCARPKAWSKNSAPSSTWSQPSRKKRNPATSNAWKKSCQTCSPPKSRFASKSA